MMRSQMRYETNREYIQINATEFTAEINRASLAKNVFSSVGILEHIGINDYEALGVMVKRRLNVDRRFFPATRPHCIGKNKTHSTFIKNGISHDFI